MAAAATTLPSEPQQPLWDWPLSVSLQATSFPGVFLRADGLTQSVNLQKDRDLPERFQLQLVPAPIQGQTVTEFAIRSVHYASFVHLEVVVLEGQEPRGTFYPFGIGRSSLVVGIAQASRFTIATPPDETNPDIKAFKLVDAPEDHPHIYLRLNGENITEFNPSGAGVVNGQTYIGPYEKILIEPF